MAEPAIQLQRKYLEAVLLVRVMFDERLVAYVDRRRLSPAADRLLTGVLDAPELAQRLGMLYAAEPTGDPVSDGFCIRLAQRADRLTVRELGFFNARTLIALVNGLPRMRRGPAEFRELAS